MPGVTMYTSCALASKLSVTESTATACLVAIPVYPSEAHRASTCFIQGRNQVETPANNMLWAAAREGRHTIDPLGGWEGMGGRMQQMER